MTLKVKERKTERSLRVFYVILFVWFFCALSKRKKEREKRSEEECPRRRREKNVKLDNCS